MLVYCPSLSHKPEKQESAGISISFQIHFRWCPAGKSHWKSIQAMETRNAASHAPLNHHLINLLEDRHHVYCVSEPGTQLVLVNTKIKQLEMARWEYSHRGNWQMDRWMLLLFGFLWRSRFNSSLLPRVRSQRIQDGKITASCPAEARGLAVGLEEDSWTNDKCSAVSVQRRCSGILVTNGRVRVSPCSFAEGWWPPRYQFSVLSIMVPARSGHKPGSAGYSHPVQSY